MAKDTCILCGVETPYEFETHVDMRIGYIEGAGQLCRACYNKGTDRSHIIVPNILIQDTPNDQELGSKVRNIYNSQNDGGYEDLLTYHRGRSKH
jgi:hypothetical protein